MKKVILFQLALLLPLFLMGFSSSSMIIPPPINGNWLNPMQNGAAENLADPYVYINLDENEELDVNLIVSTTDYEMGDYDSLYIRYTFGNHSEVKVGQW